MEAQTFNVIPNVGCDAVLGMPWVREHGPFSMTMESYSFSFGSPKMAMTVLVHVPRST